MRPIADIASDVAVCGRAWEPEVRLIGNVRADEVAALAEFVLAQTSLSCHDAVCWHCQDVVIMPRTRCERCPEECDIEGCQEPGCVAAHQ
jgi:hypothetical protein